MEAIMANYICLIIIILFLSSCTSTKPIFTEKTDYRPSIEELSTQKVVVIHSRNDSSYLAKNIQFLEDHLIWNEIYSTQLQKSLDFQNLNDLQFVSKKAGRQIGFVFGFLTGFSVGLANSGGGQGNYSINLGPEIGIMAGIANGAICSLIGHIIGYRYIYLNEL